MRKNAITRKKTFVAILLLGGAAIAVVARGALHRSSSHPEPKDAWAPASEYLANQAGRSTNWSETSQYVRMRDGVRIAVTITIPSGVGPGQTVPTVLRIARYWRKWDILWPANVLMQDSRDPALTLLNHGYVLVNMDLRGSGASFGVWPYPFSENEVKDGAEIVDWITKQSWSNGTVGTWGYSFESVTALMLLANRKPAVKACFFDRGAFDIYEDYTHPGGVPALPVTRLGSALHYQDRNAFSPLMRPPWYLRPFMRGVMPVDGPEGRTLLQEAVAVHEQNGELGELASQVTFRDDPIHPGIPLEAIGPSARADEISASGTPVLILQGWFDNPGAAFKTYAKLRNPRRVIVGPWNHNLQNTSPFAAWHGSGFELRGEILRFFDQYLKGIENGYRHLKPVQYFTLGSENWKIADSWPPPTEGRRFYADAEARLSESQPAPGDAFDAYTVNTAFRWAAGPGAILTDLSAGFPDGRISDRETLHYTSEPLTGKVEVGGVPETHLWVSSTAFDGEFFACLEDVGGDGAVQYVTSGCLRAIHRRLTSGGGHSYRRADATPLIPGEPAELVIKLAPTSYQFSAGHRIRVTFYGSDTTMFAALPGPAPQWRVFRGGSRASTLVLPVVRGSMMPEPQGHNSWKTSQVPTK